MPEPDDLGFECPVCHASVEPDWKACPACGVEFETSEEAPAATADDLPREIGAPAAAEDDLPREAEAPAPALAPPVPDELGALAEEIAAVHGGPPPQAAGRAPRVGPSQGRRGPSVFSRLGGVLGATGVALLVGGAAGALVALNWDTWVAGQAQSFVGSIQLLAVAGMGVVAAAGLALWLAGTGKLKLRGRGHAPG